MDSIQSSSRETLCDERCSPRSLEEVHLEDVILFESEHYIVIDKPPDVRMDGVFPVTIEKLLSHWFPTSSAASNGSPRFNSDSLGNSGNSASKSTHESCVAIDSNVKIGTHPIGNRARGIPAPNKFRWIHQLDFATSGVLLVAKTKLGA
jgi:23S rRNA-/tRNA-specific pseudouridylate synthase